MDIFEKAKRFVYRNARPLELALWKFHFENGTAEEVLNVLSMYQNDDGGFAYAIEPDCWNVNSTPIATWMATQKLYEIGFEDKNHPIIKGILKYLDSGKDFADGKWYNTVASNNDYPHAIWWHCENTTGEPSDNPTVSLAGFILKFADKDSSLYAKACEIVAKAADEFISSNENEMHKVRCYLNLYSYCEDIPEFNVFDLNAFKDKLIKMADESVCKEPEKWFTDYVTKPSMFFERKMSIFKLIDTQLAEKEADMLLTTQLADGSYPVTWIWHNDYNEYHISANWWKSNMIIQNMLYLKYFSRI